MNNQSARPKISVVMPVYNCSTFLEEALASLLIQTYNDFEVLAINDGSTDNSLDILKRFAKLDSRLRIISQKNTGIVKVLNRGIEEAKGEYIARMDGDDISFPNRFADQVAVLDEKPDVVLIAGLFEVIDQSSEFLYRELVLPQDDELKRSLYLRNPIAHGSTMFRKSIVQKIGGYRDLYGPTEDLDLWMRLSKEGKFEAVPTPVYRWRMNQNGLTLTNNKESIAQSREHIERHWQDIPLSQLPTRKQIIERANYYRFNYDKYGAHYKYDFLMDCAQFAAKLIAHKHPWTATKQLFIIASTGRTGAKIVLKRIHLVSQGHYNKLRRKARFGRHSSSEN
jgi:glycosyltransferase involved in cell wall biosynthesis